MPNDHTIKNGTCMNNGCKPATHQEPSERLCLILEPPSDESLTCPPFACITLLILLIHSTLSAVLSAFKRTALCAAEKEIAINMFSGHVPFTAIKVKTNLSKRFYKGLY